MCRIVYFDYVTLLKKSLFGEPLCNQTINIETSKKKSQTMNMAIIHFYLFILDVLKKVVQKSVRKKHGFLVGFLIYVSFCRPHQQHCITSWHFLKSIWFRVKVWTTFWFVIRGKHMLWNSLQKTRENKVRIFIILNHDEK